MTLRRQQILSPAAGTATGDEPSSISNSSLGPKFSRADGLAGRRRHMREMLTPACSVLQPNLYPRRITPAGLSHPDKFRVAGADWPSEWV